MAKNCPPGKILNPRTNRCVNADGKLGKQIAAAVKPKSPAKSAAKSAKKSPTKSVLLNRLTDKCNNDYDPIMMDDFKDMTKEDLQNIVKIGPGNKQNCYVLENIYEVYKAAVLSKKPAKDPMNPNHVLTDKEIKEINKKMKEKNPNHKAPKYLSPKPYPPGYELVIELSPMHMNYFQLSVTKNRQLKHNLGVVPGWVETHHTGSADNTTGVLLANIRSLWDKKLLMDNVNSCCNVPLKRNVAYWRGHLWKQRFIELCETVKAKLENA
jgi:hypothetical protein